MRPCKRWRLDNMMLLKKVFLKFINISLQQLFRVVVFRIQITLVLVFIFSRYWSKSIIRVPPGAPKVLTA